MLLWVWVWVWVWLWLAWEGMGLIWLCCVCSGGIYNSMFYHLPHSLPQDEWNNVIMEWANEQTLMNCHSMLGQWNALLHLTCVQLASPLAAGTSMSLACVLVITSAHWNCMCTYNCVQSHPKWQIAVGGIGFAMHSHYVTITGHEIMFCQVYMA